MKQFRGIYGILTSAFREDLELDEESIRRQAEFCVRGGAHGIVMPVNASEFFVLSDEERKRVIRWTVESVAGRVPVIAGVTAQSAQHAAQLAAYAAEVGADGVIAAPPCLIPLRRDQLIEYTARSARRQKFRCSSRTTHRRSVRRCLRKHVLKLSVRCRMLYM